MKQKYLPQNVVFYNNVLFSPQSVVFLINYPTTNCNILLQNVVDYHKKKKFTTKCDILPQCVTFYHRMW